VKSREKPVLKCKKLTFQYEGASKPQLINVSLKASMSARIAVLGPNGAGEAARNGWGERVGTGQGEGGG